MYTISKSLIVRKTQVFFYRLIWNELPYRTSSLVTDRGWVLH